MSFWREAGFTYVQYVSIATRSLRNVLKAEAKIQALRREEQVTRISKWSEGKQEDKFTMSESLQHISTQEYPNPPIEAANTLSKKYSQIVLEVIQEASKFSKFSSTIDPQLVITRKKNQELELEHKTKMRQNWDLGQEMTSIENELELLTRCREKRKKIVAESLKEISAMIALLPQGGMGNALKERLNELVNENANIQ
ncbi:hypothetical protein HK096_006570 [Nowakowskiella sp. JEL0078]|nr:hypothetical protein HK096_006570 [Nowakowskiella sp. JEL0078]